MLSVIWLEIKQLNPVC